MGARLRWLGRVELAFAVVVLFISSEALGPLYRSESGADPDPIVGDPFMQVIWVIVYIACFCICVLRWKTSLRTALRDPFLVALIGFAVLSVAWSSVPAVSLRRVVALVGTSLLGLYLASRFPIRRQLEIIALALGVAATLSVVCVIVLPDFGIEHEVYGGAWRGVFLYKNTLGRVMVLEAVACFLIGLMGTGRRRLAWAGTVLSVVVIILSRSLTSLVMITVLMVSVPFVRSWLSRSRLKPITWLLGTVLGGGAVSLVVTRRDQLLDALGRSDTLSGRTTLWSSAFDSLGKHPWLGFGYGGFWLGNEGASNTVVADVGWVASHAHNGYLDLCLDLGIVGLCVFIVGFCINCAYAIARLRRGFSATRLWPLLFLAFTFLYNFVERTILFRNGITWVLYVATVLSSPEEPGNQSRTGPSL